MAVLAAPVPAPSGPSKLTVLRGLMQRASDSDLFVLRAVELTAEACELDVATVVNGADHTAAKARGICFRLLLRYGNLSATALATRFGCADYSVRRAVLRTDLWPSGSPEGKLFEKVRLRYLAEFPSPSNAHPAAAAA